MMIPVEVARVKRRIMVWSGLVWSGLVKCSRHFYFVKSFLHGIFGNYSIKNPPAVCDFWECVVREDFVMAYVKQCCDRIASKFPVEGLIL